MPKPTTAQFRQWVNNHTGFFATAPSMVTPASKSRAIRFRWFNAVTFHGRTYNIGANIHPEDGGALGGMWLAGHGLQNVALRPNSFPSIPQQGAILVALQAHLNNYFAQGNNQYDYEQEVHELSLMAIGDVFG